MSVESITLKKHTSCSHVNVTKMSTTKRSQLIPIKTYNQTLQSNLAITPKAQPYITQTFTPFTECTEFIQIFSRHAKQKQMKFGGIYKHTLNVHLIIQRMFGRDEMHNVNSYTTSGSY